VPKVYIGRASLFKKWCWGNWISTGVRLTYISLPAFAKINLKWIKDLNVKPETLKVLEENMGEHFKV
jgi:hypothetical protein